MSNTPEPRNSRSSHNSPNIDQKVTGNSNQVIGEVHNSTVVNVSDGGTVHLPVTPSHELKTSNRIPCNLPRSGVSDFIGRDQKLTELDQQLQNNDRIAITAIQGMGGIGKTELALQYAIASLPQSVYPGGICWLRARNQEIATQIVSFAKVNLGLTIPDDLEAAEQVAFIWQRWPGGNALIVIDDATDYDAVAPYLPPPDARFNVLITTRQDFGSSVTTINIEELSDEDAIALLIAIVKDKQRIESQRSDAEALCQWVGNLPLGLELLGRFLVAKPDLAISKLLIRLKSKRLAAKALMEARPGMTAKLGVAAALELSWTELNEQEQDLACMLGMFAVAPIPWNLVEQCFPTVDSDELEDWRDEGLKDRSLLKRVDEGTYQLHQILQEYFRYQLRMHPERRSIIRDGFTKNLVQISESIQDTPSAHEVAELENSIAHMEELATEWNSELNNKDLIWPFIGISKFYETKGLFEVAEKWARQCLSITKIRCGERSLGHTISLNNLANLNISQGRFDEAEEHLMDAYRNCQSLSLPNLIDRVLNNIAHLYGRTERYKESLKVNKLVLESRRKNLPNTHSDIALSLNNIGQTLNSMYRYSESESKFKEALKVLEGSQSQHNRLIATCIENLGISYQEQGRHKEAEENFRNAYEMNTRFLGKEHPDVVLSLENLALRMLNKGRPKEAKKILEEAIERSAEHELPNNGISLHNLGKIYKSLGDYSRAEELYIEAIETARKFYGGVNGSIAKMLNDLASLYHDQKKYDEAERLYLESIDIKKNIFGDESIPAAISINNMAVLYTDKKQMEKASKCFKKSHQIFAKIYGENHPKTKKIFKSLSLIQNQSKAKKRKIKRTSNNKNGKGFGS